MTAKHPRLYRPPARLIAVFAAACLCGPTPDRATPGGPAGTLGELATLREARLRKMHLVRPDLIHYPISFDVVC